MENEIFEANPSLDVYFESADGSAFFTEDAAKNHARGLEDKTVKAVHNQKASLEPVEDPSESEVAKQTDEVTDPATPVEEIEVIESVIEPITPVETKATIVEKTKNQKK